MGVIILDGIVREVFDIFHETQFESDVPMIANDRSRLEFHLVVTYTTRHWLVGIVFIAEDIPGMMEEEGIVLRADMVAKWHKTVRYILI